MRNRVRPSDRVQPEPSSAPKDFPALSDCYHLLEQNGRYAVLLPINGKKKGPTWRGWQKISYSDTLKEPHQKLLHSHPNTGVRLGDCDLCTIDCDTEGFREWMLANNPLLAKTLFTKGQYGGQFWIYASGERPHQVHGLKVPQGSPLCAGAKKPEPDKDGMVQIGEFRAEGGQSVIRGIHPSGCSYSWPQVAVPIEIPFKDINWPPEVATPWEEYRKGPAYPDSSPLEDSLLRRAIAACSIDRLWEHFGYPPRTTNPVSSPFRTDKHPSLSVYDQGCRFMDHGHEAHRGDSFNFYQLATSQDAKAAFKGFIELAGLGHELERRQSATPAHGEERPRDIGDDWQEPLEADWAAHAQMRLDEEEQKEREREEKAFAELLAKFQDALCSFGQFCALPIQPRAALMGKWLKEGDTGFVFGQRGAGKTWLVDLFITHLSTGRDIDEEWNVPAQIPVVLTDGEMPWDDTRARLAGLGADPEFLHLLHHEVLFDKTGLVMNLTDERVQRVITALCLEKGAKLLVLETLSSLFRDMEENKSGEWEKVLHWLLDLRRRRIAVLIVLHAGWNADHARGTSRREDDAFWVIKVKELEDREPGEKGAKFETEFTKWRNIDRPPLTRRWHFVTEPDGTVTYNCTELSFDEKVLALIQAGLRTASAIAEELKVSRSTISKAADRLEKAKLIERRGGGKQTTYEPRGFISS